MGDENSQDPTAQAPAPTMGGDQPAAPTMGGGDQPAAPTMGGGDMGTPAAPTTDAPAPATTPAPMGTDEEKPAGAM